MASANEVINYASSMGGKDYSGMVSVGMRAGNSTLWCADFVAFVLNKKGVKSGLGSSSQQFKSLSGYHNKSGYKPKVGDVFVLTYNSTSGHTGFVKAVYDDYFIAVEGNSTGGKICTSNRYKYSSTTLAGFWTPPYSGSSSERTFNIAKQDLGNYTVTGYCGCSKCCGKSDGITSTGVKAQADWTIAVDPKEIKYGSYVEMDGHIYHAEDCGGAIKGNHIDRFFKTHQEALNWGKQTKKLTLLKGTDSELKEYAEYINNGGAYESSQEKNLTSAKIVSVEGAGGQKKNLFSVTKNGDWYDGYELYIKNYNGDIFQPVVLSGIKWTTERTGAPGKLDFTIIKDDKISFGEGAAVVFKVNGDGVFYGYVFTKTRDKERYIKVTAYDQLRYFKNRDTYIFSNKRADEILQMICDDYKLSVGKLSNTKYAIPSRIEDNSELFSIMENAIEETYKNTGARYLLYDDFGSIQLKSVNEFKTNLMVDGGAAENFGYSTSIDDDTYNRIQLYKDSDEGCREKKIYQDGDSISRFGVLQHTQSYDDKTNPDELGKQLLLNYNRITRKLSIKNAMGDIRARAGSQIYVKLNLGDIDIETNMMVQSATHNFENGKYTMDLKLIKQGLFTS